MGDAKTIQEGLILLIVSKTILDIYHILKAVLMPFKVLRFISNLRGHFH